MTAIGRGIGTPAGLISRDDAGVEAEGDFFFCGVHSPLLVDSASPSPAPPDAFPSLFLCLPRARGNLNLPPVVDEWADRAPGDLTLLHNSMLWHSCSVLVSWLNYVQLERAQEHTQDG